MSSEYWREGTPLYPPVCVMMILYYDDIMMTDLVYSSGDVAVK